MCRTKPDRLLLSGASRLPRGQKRTSDSEGQQGTGAENTLAALGWVPWECLQATPGKEPWVLQTEESSSAKALGSPRRSGQEGSLCAGARRGREEQGVRTWLCSSKANAPGERSAGDTPEGLS